MHFLIVRLLFPFDGLNYQADDSSGRIIRPYSKIEPMIDRSSDLLSIQRSSDLALFSAPLPYSSRLFPLSQRLEQASRKWRSGESAHLPPMWPGFYCRTRHHVG